MSEMLVLYRTEVGTYDASEPKLLAVAGSDDEAKLKEYALQHAKGSGYVGVLAWHESPLQEMPDVCFSSQFERKEDFGQHVFAIARLPFIGEPSADAIAGLLEDIRALTGATTPVAKPEESLTHAPCPIHGGQWFHRMTGHCSCGAMHALDEKPKCICSAQGGSVYSSGCPVHDPR